MLAPSNNLWEIDSLLDQFFQEYQTGISTLHRIHYRTDDPLSRAAFLSEVKEELCVACITFFNKQLPREELNSYLFYVVNDVAKKLAPTVPIKLKTEYLCPGCLFRKTKTVLEYYPKHLLQCQLCCQRADKAVEPSDVLLSQTFAQHKKSGFRCPECQRFIPFPIESVQNLMCPYPDCCFVGSSLDLKKMHHPARQINPIKDESNSDQTIVDASCNVEQQVEIAEELEQQVSLLQDIIDSQTANLSYHSSQFTIPHKVLVYQAFAYLLKQEPVSMVEYLLHRSRSGGFQHKVFQEYIRLLEQSLPFTFTKNKKLYRITSLLDPNLSLFDGISTFEATITPQLTIKNGTTEFYIGGRKAHLTQPYYIGKLLNVIDIQTKRSLIDQVVQYTFSVIKMQQVQSGQKVIVTHLRIPPHYQMGGMVYVNRIRHKIIERAQQLELK
jgi:hypothetical protein